MSLWHSIANYRRFSNLPREKRRIVFFSEGSADWPHLRPLLDELTAKGQTVTYLSSAPDDPGLAAASERMSTFEIGAGLARTLLFRTIDADIVVMTMPDLGVFHLKKSVYPVHYVYLFHALNSAHMIYLRNAFDAYDTIFCSGPHHTHEIRELERVNGLPPRHLVQHGSGRLDELLKVYVATEAGTIKPYGLIRVLLAPTWSASGLLEQCARELIDILLNAQLQVTFRPHPMSRTQSANKIREIVDLFSRHQNFRFEENIVTHRSLVDSDIMITDWSGIAFEYAFAFSKPILFVDVPPKVRNPDYTDILAVPLEVSLRNEIGGVIPIAELTTTPARIKALCANSGSHRERLVDLRNRWVFNVGKSSEVGALALLDILRSRSI